MGINYEVTKLKTEKTEISSDEFKAKPESEITIENK